MAAPIIIPEPQFCDADGHPYAGGTLETYIMDTTTPKATWVDHNLTALNTNPIVLDAAGRCVIWGDGEYRLILRDAAGNLIWDQAATTIVSAAMAPVVAAPTIADAVHLLGLDGGATAADIAAAISTEQTARQNADNYLTAGLNNEISRAEAAEANLQSQINAITGAGSSVPKIQRGPSEVSDADGHKRITFASAYTAQPAVVITVAGGGYGAECIVVNSNNTGFDVWFAFPSTTPLPVGPIQFEWIAAGPA